MRELTSISDLPSAWAAGISQQAYDGRCAVTGCDAVSALEAAPSWRGCSCPRTRQLFSISALSVGTMRHLRFFGTKHRPLPASSATRPSVGLRLSGVSRSLTKPGLYSSGTNVQDNREWRKNVVRFNQLDKLVRRLLRLERAVQLQD